MSGVRLARAQRWMLAAIAADDTTEAGLWLRGEGLGAQARLSIYASAWRARLLGCLRAEYPALRAVLGGPLFDAFALLYLAACPPGSWTLADLGARLPSFLAESRPDRGGEPVLAFDLMEDLALLERTLYEVFRGPGPEGGTPASEPAPVPGCRGLRIRFPLVSCLGAARSGLEVRLPAPQDTLVILYRRAYVVRLWEADPPGRELWERIAAGEGRGALDPGAVAEGLARGWLWGKGL